MLDVHTQEPIRVLSGGIVAVPYIEVPVDLLDRVRGLLERNQISHWVESQAISLDDEPFIAFINLGRAGDIARVQALLDEAE